MDQIGLLNHIISPISQKYIVFSHIDIFKKIYKNLDTNY